MSIVNYSFPVRGADSVPMLFIALGKKMALANNLFVPNQCSLKLGLSAIIIILPVPALPTIIPAVPPILPLYFLGK